MLNQTRRRQPDILEVISDLSNDEVFTPPRIANAMLDLLPDEVWTDPGLRWLDPGCKTGVFAREATKRLMVGLADEIRDESDRLEHILTEMVFGVAITELTSLMSRRTVYCSKDAAGKHSVVSMPTSSGNVWFRRTEHSFGTNGRCEECGAAEDDFGGTDGDNHAYAFIHDHGRRAIAKDHNMQFDVIVGNPPYQMTGGGGGSNDTPIYDDFVEQAIALDPRYICMIIPSRWMAGGRGLQAFRSSMLGDERIRVLVDYENAVDLFPTVGINGGICYFLWDRDNPGACASTYHRNGKKIGPTDRKLGEFDVFVRDPRALSTLRKVQSASAESFAALVSGDTPFGLATNFTNYEQDAEPGQGEVRLYANVGTTRVQGSMQRSELRKNKHLIDVGKVLIPKAGSGREREKSGVDMVLGPPIIAGPGSVCTQTYLAIGPLASQAEAKGVESYLRTRFLRFLVSLRKISQHAMRSVYTWVPQQPWDRNWTDADLYEKYEITEEEQTYIEERIREMPS